MASGAGQRFRLTAAERRDMWQRWERGEPLSEISKCMGRAIASIQGWISEAGGFAPRTPRRGPRALSLNEREDISRGLAAGEGVRAMARRLGRSPSTICREIARNGGLRWYRAAKADLAAYERAKRPQSCLLDSREHLARVIAGKLQLRWSPQQIAGWLKREYPDDAQMTVSHETIYRTLFVQARGALKKELTSYLRAHKRMRRPRNRKDTSQRYHIKDAVSISERPAQAEDRAIPGHWEGDLLFGTLSTQVATLVERRSRYVMIVKVAGKDTASVVDALTRRVKSLPQGLMSTLTWDRGSEMAAHKRFSIATDVKVFFCDPHSPWQRGSNENTNRLLRQYMPKGMDLSGLSQANLDRIANEMNGRPRKTLGYACPAEVLSECVATTG